MSIFPFFSPERESLSLPLFSFPMNEMYVFATHDVEYKNLQSTTVTGNQRRRSCFGNGIWRLTGDSSAVPRFWVGGLSMALHLCRLEGRLSYCT